MFSTLTSAFNIPELRQKIVFLLSMFVVYVIGAHIPVPGINTDVLEGLIRRGGLLTFLDLFSGGSLRRFSIFALGITPYINASIIFQLLTVVVPKLEELAKEGESGRKILSQWTRYLTIGLAFLQSTGMYFMLHKMGDVLRYDTWFFRIIVIVTLVGGTAFLMWLGEEISNKGIGNGVSLIIFVGILSSLPQQFLQTWQQVKAGGNYMGFLFLMLISISTVAFIIFIHKGERKIPVQYAKRIVGRKVYGGQTSYIPLRVNQAGVIPIIFAISFLLLPATIAQLLPVPPDNFLKRFAQYFPQSMWYNMFYFILVFVFTYFYTAVVFNPKEVAERMKKHGGFILGIRPGKPTSEYLERIMIKITFMGALFLGIIAVLPSIVVSTTKLNAFNLGGTSILIVVGVALDTLQAIEAQLLMRNYEGFLT